MAGDDAAVAWADFVAEEPAMAAEVRHLLERYPHHVLATLRADGSPRVSGTEVQFAGGHLWAGAMPGSAKSRDLARDGRFALHTNPGPDASMAGGDAKVSGVAELVTDDTERAVWVATRPEPQEGPFDLIRFRPVQVVLTAVHPDGDRIVVRSWHPGRGVQVIERA